jgi:NTP pyrophosphatase (non-canonical NTP hydrolase)
VNERERDLWADINAHAEGLEPGERQAFLATWTDARIAEELGEVHDAVLIEDEQQEGSEAQLVAEYALSFWATGSLKNDIEMAADEGQNEFAAWLIANTERIERWAECAVGILADYIEEQEAQR